MNKHSENGGIRIYFCRNSAHANEIPSALSKLASKGDVILEAVPCCGRIDPRYLLKAFEGGSSAVCILACPSGQCKLMEGNLRAVSRTRAVRELLSEAGLDPNSVQIYLPDSPETDTLETAVEIVSQFVSKDRQSAHEVLA